MSVQTWEVGDLMEVEILKRFTASPTTVWRNTYQLKMRSSNGTPDNARTLLAPLVGQLITFEQGLHMTTVQLYRGIIRTWENEPSYNPGNFLTYEYTTQFGTMAAPAAGETSPIEMCAYVSRQVVSGRIGRLFYRGVVKEPMYEGAASGLEGFRWSTSNAAYTALKSSFDAKLVALKGTLFPGGTSIAQLGIVSVINEVVTWRDYVDLVLEFPVFRKYNNRYYRKTI